MRKGFFLFSLILYIQSVSALSPTLSFASVSDSGLGSDNYFERVLAADLIVEATVLSLKPIKSSSGHYQVQLRVRSCLRAKCPQKIEVTYHSYFKEALGFENGFRVFLLKKDQKNPSQYRLMKMELGKPMGRPSLQALKQFIVLNKSGDKTENKAKFLDYPHFFVALLEDTKFAYSKDAVRWMRKWMKRWVRKRKGQSTSKLLLKPKQLELIKNFLLKSKDPRRFLWRELIAQQSLSVQKQFYLSLFNQQSWSQTTRMAFLQLVKLKHIFVTQDLIAFYENAAQQQKPKVLTTIAKTQDLKLLPYFLKLLKESKSSTLKVASISALSNFPKATWEDKLLAMREKLDAAGTRALLTVLAEVNSEQVLPLLRGYLFRNTAKNPSPYYNLSFVLLLKIQSPKAKALLAEFRKKYQHPFDKARTHFGH